MRPRFLVLHDQNFNLIISPPAVLLVLADSFALNFNCFIHSYGFMILLIWLFVIFTLLSIILSFSFVFHGVQDLIYTQLYCN